MEGRKPPTGKLFDAVDMNQKALKNDFVQEKYDLAKFLNVHASLPDPQFKPRGFDPLPTDPQIDWQYHVPHKKHPENNELVARNMHVRYYPKAEISLFIAAIAQSANQFEKYGLPNLLRRQLEPVFNSKRHLIRFRLPNDCHALLHRMIATYQEEQRKEQTVGSLRTSSRLRHFQNAKKTVEEAAQKAPLTARTTT